MIKPQPHYRGASLYADRKTSIEYYDDEPDTISVWCGESYDEDAKLNYEQAVAFAHALIESVEFAFNQQGKPIALPRPKQYLVPEGENFQKQGKP